MFDPVGLINTFGSIVTLQRLCVRVWTLEFDKESIEFQVRIIMKKLQEANFFERGPGLRRQSNERESNLKKPIIKRSRASVPVQTNNWILR